MVTSISIALPAYPVGKSHAPECESFEQEVREALIFAQEKHNMPGIENKGLATYELAVVARARIVHRLEAYLTTRPAPLLATRLRWYLWNVTHPNEWLRIAYPLMNLNTMTVEAIAASIQTTSVGFALGAGRRYTMS